MSRHIKKREAPSGITVMLAGTLASFIITAALSFIFSFIAYSMPDPDGSVGIFSIASLIIAAAAVGFSVSKIRGDGGVILAVLSALLFTLILLLAGLIAGGGALSLGCIINYLCHIAVSALAAVLGRRRRKVRR